MRIPDSLAQQLDQLVEEGRFLNRTDAVRAAVERLVENERHRQIDEAIIEGYRRIPPTDPEQRWAADAGRQMIAEEPW